MFCPVKLHFVKLNRDKLFFAINFIYFAAKKIPFYVKDIEIFYGKIWDNNKNANQRNCSEYRILGTQQAHAFMN